MQPLNTKIDDFNYSTANITARPRRFGNPEEQPGNTKTAVPA